MRAAAYLSVPVLCVGLVACGSDDGPSRDAERLVVVTTTSILGDLVANVVGDGADVVVLLGAGSDPHDYQPSPKDVERIRSADLVVANGGGLEEGLVDVIEETEADGGNVLELLDHLDPLPLGDGDHDDEGEEDASDHDHGMFDPHFWQDPQRTALAVEKIGDALAALGKGPWTDAAPAYAAEVRALDAAIEDLLVNVPTERRVLVTDHDAFGYFAKRYGFEVVGVIIPGGTTLASPSPKDLEELAREIARTGVPAIFSENTAPSDLADALADEVGGAVEVVELYSDALGEPGSGADSYLDMMWSNAQRIAEALQ